MHGAGGHGKGFPSCLSVSMGNATVVESNNAPNISALMRVFFIDFFSLVCKINSCKFPLRFCITYNPLALLGISESGTDFSQTGNSEEGRSKYCSLEYSQGSTVDLLKSHFGTVLGEPFTLLPRGIREDCSLFSEWISFYRIKKSVRPRGEISGRMLA